MLKLHVVLTLLIASINFIGCGRQSGTMPQEQTKVVKFESTLEGATVFVDDNYVVRAPADIALTVGKHNVIFDKDGYN